MLMEIESWFHEQFQIVSIYSRLLHGTERDSGWFEVWISWLVYIIVTLNMIVFDGG
jgi:hypothetical protein